MKMENSKNCNNVANIATVSLLFVGFLYLFCIWSSSLSNPLSSSHVKYSYHRDCSHSQFDKGVEIPINHLREALEKASMPNKTVIIAVVNKAYVDQPLDSEKAMLDLFLESFWLGENTSHLLDHLLLVAVDQTAFDRCNFKRLNCYKLETDGVDFGAEKLYMSEDFIKMMWRRTLLLLEVLELGYNFIFTDTDVMWLRNPFHRLSNNEGIDLQISTDQFNGDSKSQSNLINTGFYYVKSNNKTIALYKKWYSEKSNSTGLKEQDVLLKLTSHGIFKELGLEPIFLDTLYFSGFCSESRDIRSVVTVHANCCRSITAKVTDLTSVLRNWKRFKRNEYGNFTVADGNNSSATSQWSRHLTCERSWLK